MQIIENHIENPITGVLCYNKIIFDLITIIDDPLS